MSNLRINLLLVILLVSTVLAVTSRITHHTSAADFERGDANDIVISSRGILKLSRAWQKLTEDFNDVWAINSIVINADKIYIGTSPNGGLYEYSLGKIKQIYHAQSASPEPNDKSSENSAEDANTTKPEQHLANEHIFAMASDISGRLLIGISGKRCVLCRLEGDKLKEVFEPNDAKYIFAIATDDIGNIYLGTGPKGKIYKLNSTCTKSELFFDSDDKNILSLDITADGAIIAGSDSRGLVYKIDRKTKKVSVLYDADQPEITAVLCTDEGDIYVAATSAELVEAQEKFARSTPLPGKPEQNQSNSSGQGTLRLQIANSPKQTEGQTAPQQVVRKRPPRPGKLSYIYKITREGFVTDVFAQPVVLFSLATHNDKLLVGTGNEAELFLVEPKSEDQTVIFKDRQASQITAIAIDNNEIYIGTANPARLIKISDQYVSSGNFDSALIDASQPANWGKLQIEADIPNDTSIFVSARSGNVGDVNDASFSDWSEPVEVNGPVQLACPLGRFCQYRLILKSATGQFSPIVREVAVASTIPNLAPKIEEVTVERYDKPEKAGIFKISYKASDDNDDKLTYKIDFRKLGRQRWIEIEDDIEQNQYEWDTRTVEDGRYEIRVTADDERSNSPATKLTASRISDPVVVDNTGPSIEMISINDTMVSAEVESPLEVNKDKTSLKLRIKDSFSAIAQIQYTIDSNEDWLTAMADDLVFDTTDETVTIVLSELEEGDHVLAIRSTDAVGNTTYKSFEITAK